MKVCPAIVLAVLVSSAVLPARAAETVDQWIAKARAYLGGDTALKSVTSIHFTGVLETKKKVPSETDKSVMVEQPVSLPIEIVFQKPFQQRITITSPQVIETTVLDGYDAWQKRTNPQNPAQWQVTLLDAAQVKRLRANTWECLNFFVGLEKIGGSVQLAGDVTVDGLACVKLSFAHANNIIFHRFFDRATGRLVKTETENGSEIREEGEMVVNGIRFTTKNINKAPNGQGPTIIFNKIVLNEKIPASEFAVPSF